MKVGSRRAAEQTVKEGPEMLIPRQYPPGMWPISKHLNMAQVCNGHLLMRANHISALTCVSTLGALNRHSEFYH